jgi:hypothetical protein
MNARDIQQYARETTDAEGNPVIQIPLHIWQQFTGKNSLPQIEQINVLLQDWQEHPQDSMPDAWWDEFTDFLQQNRLNFEENTNE